MVKHTWEGRKILHRFSGQTSTIELKRAIITHQCDWRFDDLTEVVCDFSSCSGITIYPGDIEEIAALDGAAGKSNPKIRITVITDHPEIKRAAQSYINSRMSCYPLRIIAPATDQAAHPAHTEVFAAGTPSFSYSP